MEALILVAAMETAAASQLARPADRSLKEIPCFCTDKTGQKIDLGETVCLSVDGRSFMALCSMSLNNPSWRDTGEGCPTG